MRIFRKGHQPNPAVTADSDLGDGLTTDPGDPRLHETRGAGPQRSAYLVLSAAERAKGYVRPLRRAYQHVGLTPTHPLRDLTAEEAQRYQQAGYVKYEPYPSDGSAVRGRYWTQAQLDNHGCGSVTTMALPLCETYARDPSFYGATLCVRCAQHLPVGEFVWTEDGARVGT